MVAVAVFALILLEQQVGVGTDPESQQLMKQLHLLRP
jgi:hypothetical protein